MNLLSKTFDTVNHYILIEKLYKYGFHDNTYKWLKKLIFNRSVAILAKQDYSAGFLRGPFWDPYYFLFIQNN